jgi:hypothetical protein
MCQHVIALFHQLASAVWLFAKDHSSHGSQQTQTYPVTSFSIVLLLANFPNNILLKERYHQHFLIVLMIQHTYMLYADVANVYRK